MSENDLIRWRCVALLVFGNFCFCNVVSCFVCSVILLSFLFVCFLFTFHRISKSKHAYKERYKNGWLFNEVQSIGGRPMLLLSTRVTAANAQATYTTITKQCIIRSTDKSRMLCARMCFVHHRLNNDYYYYYWNFILFLSTFGYAFANEIE